MIKKNTITILVLVFALSCIAADKKVGLKHSPKNIIVMISDGCGYNQINAASVYQYGKTGTQAYENFPVRIAMSTYPADGKYNPKKASKDFGYLKKNPTDSAAAATAMSCGVKTHNGAIGVDSKKNRIKNIVERCEELGMATGVITTVEFSHATPAGFVAHNTSRNNYSDIANEMIYQSACEVIMGCGAADYDNNGKADSASKKFVGGSKTWTDITDDNQIKGTDANGDGINDIWTVVRSRADFQSLAAGQTPARVLGIPYIHETLQQRRAGDTSAGPYAVPMTQTVPTLAEMTRAAINVLDNDDDGFFLMIEGGAIDWACHANQLGRMIEEEIDFNKSVEAVIGWVNENSSWDDTLLIVTGDHETGYLTGADSGLNKNEFVWNSGGHTNQLIPFFAKGQGCQLFAYKAVNNDPVRGKYIDNTDIANTIFELLKEVK